MLSQSYSLPAFELPQPRWARGLLLALAAHAALVLLFYWPQTALEPVVLPPPAVMMNWAAQIEAPESKRRCRWACSRRNPPARPAEQQQPDLPKLARAESKNRDGAEEARQTPPSAKIAAEAAGTGQRDAQCRRVQRRRAAGADALPSDRRTDQQRRQQQRAGQTVVESLVKGKLNRIKDYPLMPAADGAAACRRSLQRRRAGAGLEPHAAGAFRHRVAGSGSGGGGVTRPAAAAAAAGDAAAGAVKVTMPIDFNLAELNARR